jgi:hypothetical protein
MPKSTKRKSVRMHCRNCGKLRLMSVFTMIDTKNLNEKGEPTILPVKIRKALELISSDIYYKIPQYYSGLCGTCNCITYYGGSNHSKSLQVLNM